jgi:SAM-dependent methyltransferase
MTVADANRAIRGILHRALWNSRHALRRTFRRPIPGRFQPYNHTMPDRYPWLFRFAREELANTPSPRLLSFGCSRGEEVLSLRRYFPGALIKGIDVDPANIAACRARTAGKGGFAFATAATTAEEPADHYDAVFCLAVLCHGDLTVTGARRSDRLLRFDDFERVISGLARCLKPGGLLLLHTTSFRFCDTVTAAEFTPLLDAEPAQMAPDVLFDRDNRLMPGARYYSVAFRKHA